jgi:hypothetical protein
MEDTCPSHRDSPAAHGRCHHCAALRLWASVPPTTRHEVDALLRRRAVVPAVAALRAGMPDGGTPPLWPALDAVLERRQWLTARGEVTPPVLEPTAEEMVAKVIAASAPAVAVEVCWDGDSFGWIEDLVAVVARPGGEHPRFDEVTLWSYRGPGAADRGRAVARHLGVPFHFEHPGAPDVDLPRWWDRCGSQAQHRS